MGRGRPIRAASKARGVGLEPTTTRLTAEHSAIELPPTVPHRVVNLWSVGSHAALSPSRGCEETDARLDLSVAVGAQQGALSRLGAQHVHRACESARAQAEPLLRPVQVMELERSDAPVVAAGDALSAGLGYQCSLRGTAPAGDRLRAAARTPKRPPRQDERRSAVARALPGPSRHSARASSRRRGGLKTVTPQPVAHGRGTAPNAGCDLANREVLAHEPRQGLAIQRSARGVLSMRRAQIMLLQPIPDRRRVALEPATHLCQRAALLDQPFQCLPFHGHTNTSSCLGRNPGERPRPPARQASERSSAASSSARSASRRRASSVR